MTTRSWTNPNGGNWTTAGDWSLPGFPGSGDVAFIDAAGIYTVTINDLEQPQSTELGYAGATLAVANTGTLTGALTLNAGTLSVAGVLLNATVTNNGGTVVEAGGTLDGVTWIGPLVLNTPSGAISIRDGLTITDGLGHAGTISLSNGVLAFADGIGLDNGVLDLGPGAEPQQTGGSPITFGPHELVRQLNGVGGVTFFGIVNNKGTIDLAGPKGSAATFQYAGHVNSGTIEVGERVTFTQSLSNAATGTITVGQNGTLTIAASQVGTRLDGSLTVNQGGSLIVQAIASGAGTIHLATGGVARLVDYAGNVHFDDAAGTLKLLTTSFNGTIGGFQNGDTLDFLSGGILSADWSANVLNLHENGFTATLNLIGNYAGLTFAAVSDGGNGQDIVVSCFRAGTRIATTRGPVAVESLSVGEQIVTHDGTSSRVIWLGQRRIDLARHPCPEQARPFRVRAGAFGPKMPSRDLWLSPDHALFVKGALIPVKYLAEPGAIEQVAVPSVDYWHVELERHAVVLAEGLPAESYLDTGQRADFAEAGQVTTLHPSFCVRAWEAQGCAPLVVAGPLVERTRATLRARAKIAVAA